MVAIVFRVRFFVFTLVFPRAAQLFLAQTSHQMSFVIVLCSTFQRPSSTIAIFSADVATAASIKIHTSVEARSQQR